MRNVTAQIASTTARDNDTPENAGSTASSMVTLWRFLALFVAHRRCRAFVVFGCLLISSLLNGLSLLALLPLIQMSGMEAETGSFRERFHSFLSVMGLGQSMGAILFFFLVLFTTHAMLLRQSNLFTTLVEQSFTKSLQHRLYAAIMRCEWMFFLQNRNSDLMFSLTSNVSRVSSGTMSLVRLISTMCLVSVQVAICIAISPLITLALLGCAALFWLFVLRQHGNIRKRGHEQVQLSQRLYGNVTDHLAGMKEVRSACSEEQQIADYGDTIDAMQKSMIDHVKIRENISVLWKVSSMIVLSGILYFSVQIMQVPVVDVVLLTALASRLLPKFQAVQSGWQQVLHMLPAFESLMELLQRCEASEEPTDQNSENDVYTLRHQLDLKHVQFCYDPDQPQPTLCDIDLRIPVGTITAFVGHSGAGKTTLADVLMGLLLPSKGQMLVDGQVLDGSRLRPWRRSIGYVPQETFLLHDTLRANLQWSNPDASDDELWASLRLASAIDFVEGLPDRLDTVVGDRGIRLSGGERQRIALARALVRRPKLLILDEATSSLDSENQHRVQEAIRNLHGQMSIVIIAHRLSSVRDADQIIVLDQGRIVESGAYATLSRNVDGHFGRMLRQEVAKAA